MINDPKIKDLNLSVLFQNFNFFFFLGNLFCIKLRKTAIFIDKFEIFLIRFIKINILY